MKIFFIQVVAMNCLIIMASSNVEEAFHERLDDFINSSVYSDECGNFRSEVLRLNFSDAENYFDACIGDIYDSLETLNKHKCNDPNYGSPPCSFGSPDFHLAGHSWLLNKFWNHPWLVAANNGTLRQDMIKTYLDLPMWLSDDAYFGPQQFWSENHQIGYYAAQYLIGHAFATVPELSNSVFYPSKLTGAELRGSGKVRVLEWLEYRLRFGFSEFNSDTYGPIAYDSLSTLVVLSPDEDIRLLAKTVMILQEFDHIIGSKGDQICTARGRTYTEGRLGEKNYYHLRLLKGYGSVQEAKHNKQSVMFALNMLNGDFYPTALLEIAEHVELNELISREHFGLGGFEGSSAGLGMNNDCWFWLSDGAYFSPEYPECIFILGDTYRLWNTSDTWQDVSVFLGVWNRNPDLVRKVARAFEPLGGGPVLGPINMYTYRTEHFLLSSVQNYHGGWMSGQQHVWALTHDIGNKGTVFSHQPLNPDASDPEYYWRGNILPKVFQYKSTLISMHNPHDLVNTIFKPNMTHAHFNTDAMDRVVDQLSVNGWIFGQDGEAFVGLYIHKLASFLGASNKDLVSANATENVYILEAGNKASYGSFEEFVRFINASEVDVTIGQRNSALSCYNAHCDNHHEMEKVINCVETLCEDFVNTKQLNCLNSNQESSFTYPLLEQRPLIEPNWPALECLSTNDDDAGFPLMSVNYNRQNRSMSVSWDSSKMIINGEETSVDEYPRYDNPYSRVEWGDRKVSIDSENCHITLDFDALKIDSYCDNNEEITSPATTTTSSTIRITPQSKIFLLLLLLNKI